MTVVLGIFAILHGLVHVLYLGQARRYFELRPGLTWPDQAWAFSAFGETTTRLLASGLCALAAAGFIAAGLGALLGQGWWRALLIVVAVFSSVVYLLLWNGKLRHLPDQGAVGILINLALVGAVAFLG